MSRWLLVLVVGLIGCRSESAGKPQKQSVAPTLDAAVARAETHTTPSPQPPAAPPPKTRRVFTNKLADHDDFVAYSKQVAGERFTRFVIDVKTNAIYYFDVKVYPVHREFVFAELYKTKMTKAKERRFTRNYGRVKPDFVLGYLVHHLGPDVWTMAFWSGDLIKPAMIKSTYDKVKATFYMGDELKFRPDSHFQEWRAQKLNGAIPVITNNKLYKSSTYQLFNPGKAVGVLRIVDAKAKYEDLTFERTDIVVLPESLPDITPVAGIISDTFSTPLSHVSLRARAWGIPNVGFKQATKTYRELAGKTVYFEAGPVKHVLRPATAGEIAEWKRRRATAKRVVVPAADLQTRQLRRLVDLRAKQVDAYGAKAANLGEVARAKLKHVNVPPGFGIPIVYYAEHLKRHKLDTKIAALLADKKFRNDARYRKRELAALRSAIVKAPLDTAFRKAFLNAVKKLAGDNGVFVRSSTNAEDLPGFNGAGLYDTVPNVKGDDKLVAAVKQVWASVWNLRAYEERQFFGIDHAKVYGAVLVQLAVNPTAAGVLITPGPKAPRLYQTYVINAKSGLGMRVVGGKKTPEIVHYNHYNRSLRIISRSDERTQLVFDANGGIKEVPIANRWKPVLSDPRARRLGAAAARIRTLFPPDRPLDIEWLFVGDKLHIVQARPYVSGRK